MMATRVLHGYGDYEAEGINEAMASLRVWRPTIVNREKRLAGIVSLRDVVLRHEYDAAGHVLRANLAP
jgi:CBS domain-containing protein